MEKLMFGETAVLADGREYVCFGNLEENGKDYVYLVSNKEPVEVKFATQNLANGELTLALIKDQNEKKHLISLFQENMNQNHK